MCVYDMSLAHIRRYQLFFFLGYITQDFNSQMCAELVKLVEGTVRSEYKLTPNRPIYLIGESVGGCLALSVAANNPHIDLMLIVANPGFLPSHEHTYVDAFVKD